MGKEDPSFFDEFKSLCKRKLLPEAKRAWGELKKGAGDVKNTIATKQSQIQPRVREMKTKLTDAWERSDKKKGKEEPEEPTEETGQEHPEPHGEQPKPKPQPPKQAPSKPRPPKQAGKDKDDGPGTSS